MPNRAIELHDSRVERVEQAADSIVLWLSAYMHESDGRPGWDRGTGWSLPIRLVVENGKFASPSPPPALWILDGDIAIDDRRLENVLPLPFDERGDICLSLNGEAGEIVINGSRAYIEAIGQAVYVEEFDPT